MSRIASCFAQLRATQRKALIPFITAGDPSPALTVPLMHALVAAGADILELGVPFSDPMADGPVIQRASERALAHGVRLRDVLEMVRDFRRDDDRTPVVLMGYLNPIEILGYQTFATTGQAAGIDGVLTVDLPPEEATDFLKMLHAHQIDPIFLLSPTTSEARIARICREAKGFIYYVSVKGVTGSAALDVSVVADKLATIRTHTTLPIGVGFGIKNAHTAAQVAGVADAVIVGSALVQQLETLTDPAAALTVLPALLREIRQGMDNRV